MGWYILKHIFSTLLAVVNVRRLSDQEKDLEILVLRQPFREAVGLPQDGIIEQL